MLLQSSIISRYSNQHFDLSTQHQLWHLQTGMDNILVIQTSCLELTNVKICLHRGRTYYAQCKSMHLPHPTLYCCFHFLPHTWVRKYDLLCKSTSLSTFLIANLDDFIRLPSKSTPTSCCIAPLKLIVICKRHRKSSRVVLLGMLIKT